MEEIFLNASNVPVQENLFLKSSAEVDGWFLMDNPFPVVTIVLTYLLFILKIGPEFMKDREPYNIKGVIAVYNLYQTVYNGFLVTKLFLVSGAISYIWNHSCHPLDPATNPFFAHYNASSWYYMMSKIADLLDTLFFVLRKKQSHITFLHVYHHAMMVSSTWFFLKYVKGQQGVVIGWINALVHTIMYSYYFLSTFGPSVQKYLWWKKYITKMQIIQFVIIFIFLVSLQLLNCEVSKFYNYYGSANAVVFMVLFYRFYKKTYMNRGSKKE